MISKATAALTSYDFLKTFALVTMIIDHIGFFFYPDDEILRTIGRLSFPVWFFLIGYARSRDLSWPIWFGGVSIIATNIIFGAYLFPLNILVTIIAVRLVLDRVMGNIEMIGQSDPYFIWKAFVGFCVLSVPTYMFLEYGALALIFAAAGYMIRHMQDQKWQKRETVLFLLAVVGVYWVSQSLLLGMSLPQSLLLLAGLMVLSAVFLMFQVTSFEKLSTCTPCLLQGVFKLCGRRTLEIYVAHIILFRIAAFMLNQDEYDWFAPKVFMWS